MCTAGRADRDNVNSGIRQHLIEIRERRHPRIRGSESSSPVGMFVETANNPCSLDLPDCFRMKVGNHATANNTESNGCHASIFPCLKSNSSREP